MCLHVWLDVLNFEVIQFISFYCWFFWYHCEIQSHEAFWLLPRSSHNTPDTRCMEIPPPTAPRPSNSAASANRLSCNLTHADASHLEIASDPVPQSAATQCHSTALTWGVSLWPPLPNSLLDLLSFLGSKQSRWGSKEARESRIDVVDIIDVILMN
jgi:hypothetical protein